MQAHEFHALLEHFPRVRDATFRFDWTRPKHEQIAVANTSSSSSSSPPPQPVAAASPGVEAVGGEEVRDVAGEEVRRFEGPFAAALKEFLRGFYEEEMADAIAEEFQRSFKRNSKSLSLDDIEALASRV